MVYNVFHLVESLTQMEKSGEIFIRRFFDLIRNNF